MNHRCGISQDHKHNKVMLETDSALLGKREFGTGCFYLFAFLRRSGGLQAGNVVLRDLTAMSDVLPADECEKNVGNGKYSGGEVGIDIAGVEMLQGL